jgi:glucose/mannose-6-phosphate isomerase
MIVHKTDPTGFVPAIQRKAVLVRDGYKAGIANAPRHLKPDGLLFSGMGFSGFCADLVRDAATRALDIPFTVVKHYQYPHHVKAGWHCLAVSYSGETEETLAITREALRRGVEVSSFSTGGTLSTISKRNVPQPTGYQPRAAFAHAWFSVLGYLEGAGILPEPVPVDAAVAAVKEVDATCGPGVPETNNEAMQLARKLVDHLPQIYATPAFYGVGEHFRGSLNENAKKIADVDLVPESNHNDLSGWGGDVKHRGLFAVLCLSHANQRAQMRQRLDFMEERYRGWGVPWHNKTARAIETFQDHVVEQARMVQFLDYTSVYVAALRGQDPADIKDIKALKEFLRKGT